MYRKYEEFPLCVPEGNRGDQGGVGGTYLLLTVQLLVRDVSRQVGVQESTQGQAITPAAAEIGDIDVLWGESSINHQTVPSHRL